MVEGSGAICSPWLGTTSSCSRNGVYDGSCGTGSNRNLWIRVGKCGMELLYVHVWKSSKTGLASLGKNSGNTRMYLREKLEELSTSSVSENWFNNRSGAEERNFEELMCNRDPGMKAWTYPGLGNCATSTLLGSSVHSLSPKSFQAAPACPRGALSPSSSGCSSRKAIITFQMCLKNSWARSFTCDVLRKKQPLPSWKRHPSFWILQKFIIDALGML